MANCTTGSPPPLEEELPLLLDVPPLEPAPELPELLLEELPEELLELPLPEDELLEELEELEELEDPDELEEPEPTVSTVLLSAVPLLP